MNKICELSYNVKKKYFTNNNNEYEYNESTNISIEDKLCNDDNTIIITIDDIQENNKYIKHINKSDLEELNKDINDEPCDTEEYIYIYRYLFNANKISIKYILRILADCFSFISAVCIWGILEDIFTIISKDNDYTKLYCYLILATIFSAINLFLGFYFLNYSKKKKLIHDDAVNSELANS